MGIRYYAYAFDKDQTDEALANPWAFISSDPLADAWGLEPHATVAIATFEQAVPERDMLYLDKAWRHLQLLTRPAATAEPARPAFRMFEGEVTMRGGGWIPWCRALAPAEVAEIADDLVAIEDELAPMALRRTGATGNEVAYALEFLDRARVFVAGLAADERGMAYMIG